MPQTQTIGVGAASLECTVNGSGDPLVVLANAGCSTGYLERFGERLPRSQIIAINMRGVGASRGPLDNATLHDLASDVAGVLEALQCGPVHILGHAFGNRIARCLAADHPAIVRGVILVAAGGLIGPSTPLGSSFRDAPPAKLTGPECVALGALAISGLRSEHPHVSRVLAAGSHCALGDQPRSATERMVDRRQRPALGDSRSR